MSNFALIGAAGYIAPRHLNAIKETGNDLIAALDPRDSVGILDSYFPSAAFFTEFERFQCHIEDLRDDNVNLDYVSIASPNYLHEAHIRFALRLGAHAICEKPLVIEPRQFEGLRKIQGASNRRVFSVLQLRLHPSIIKLREHVNAQLEANPGMHFDVNLTYLTSRGNWYLNSWKGEEARSGGIVANIGVHFFDILVWIFGNVEEHRVHILDADVASGVLEFRNARVRWFLSTNYRYLPEEAKRAGKTTYRSISIDGEEIEFSTGFTDLHVSTYRDILDGRGFGLDDAEPCINLVDAIRRAEPLGYVKDDCHPIVREVVEGNVSGA